MLSCLILAFLMPLSILDAQCFQDRHNTSLDASWLSCGVLTSPNPEREASHWIMYDLGEIVELQKTHFWNLNTPDRQDMAIRELAIDYSQDGNSWNTWGTVVLQESGGSSFYEGQEGPDLSGSNARFVLLTALSNYGGVCFGLSEVKIEIGESLISDVAEVDALAIDFNLSPNPATDLIHIQIESEESFNAEILISNMLGQKFFSSKIFIQKGQVNLPVQLEDIPTGIYSVSIFDGDKLSTKELVISN